MIALIVYFMLQLLSVYGTLTIKQVRTDDNPGTWEVEGVATYEFSGCCPAEFDFQCLTDDDSVTVSWRKGDQTLSQNAINGGVEFSLDPLSASAGVYTCTARQKVDPFAETERVNINITADNPAANAKEETIEAIVGDTVRIQFYASGLFFANSYPNASDISWKFNEITLNHGTLINDNRILVIENVQASHAGTYKFIVEYSVAQFTQQATATTTLSVKVPSAVTSDPQNQTAQEWTDVTLSCIASGSPPFDITWAKVNGSLPSDSTVTNTVIGGNMMESELTIFSVRVSDEGLYVCNATFDDNTYPNVSLPGLLTVQPVLRFKYAPSGSDSEPTAILLHTTQASFSVDCEGSGTRTWLSPNGTIITTNTSSTFYQQETNDQQILNFTSYISEYDGLYKCNSSLSVVNSIYITGDNPVVYAVDEVIFAAPNTNRTLTVHVSGTDPAPTPADIQWYFNGSPLELSDVYMLDENRTSLSISVIGKEVGGMYVCNVTTAQGSDSTAIRVTFPDPPQAIVNPSSVTVKSGDTVSFTCNATGELPFTVTWLDINTDDSASMNGNILTLSNVNKNHHGNQYTCEVTDGINTVRVMANLKVEYAPIAEIGVEPLQTFPVLEEVCEEGKLMATFFCRADAYPPPTLNWEFNGQELPDGATENDFGSYRQLTINRPVHFTDEGQWKCVATNSEGQFTSNLTLRVFAQPVISSVLPLSSSVSLNNTDPLVYSVSESHVGPVLKCVGRGWPAPSIRWFDGDNNQLTTAYTINEDTVIAELLLNGSESNTHYQCQVANEYGTETYSVQIIRGSYEGAAPLQPLEPPSSTTIEFRLQLKNVNCSQWTDDMLQDRISAIQTSLMAIVKSLCQGCSAEDIIATITINASPNCKDDLSGIFSGTISSSTVNRTVQVYEALGSWYTGSPILVVGAFVYPVSQDCQLLVGEQEIATECTTPTTSPTSTITEDPTIDLTVVWAIVVGVIVTLILIVVAILIILFFVFMKNILMNRKDDRDIPYNPSESMLRSYNSSVGSNVTATTTLDRQQVTSFSNALHRTSSQNSMLDNAQYLQSETIQAIRASDIGHGGFSQYNPPQPDGPRVLLTSTDHLSPSPQSTSRDQVHIREKDDLRLHTETPDGTARVPPQEQLYQSATRNSTVQEDRQNDHQYDLIKTNATLKDSPSRRPGSQTFQRGSTSPRQRSLSQQILPEPHVIEPYAALLTHQMSASSIQPSPYEQSMSSIPARRTPPRPPHTRATSSDMIDGFNNNESLSQLAPVNEGTLDAPTPHPWYSESETGSVTYQSSEAQIHPYMSTVGSQIVAPYSEPQSWMSSQSQSQSSLPPDSSTMRYEAV